MKVSTSVMPPVAESVDRVIAAKLRRHQHNIDPVSAVLLVVDAVVVLIIVTLLIVRPPRRTVDMPALRRAISAPDLTHRHHRVNKP